MTHELRYSLFAITHTQITLHSTFGHPPTKNVFGVLLLGVWAPYPYADLLPLRTSHGMDLQKLLANCAELQNIY